MVPRRTCRSTPLTAMKPANSLVKSSVARIMSVLFIAGVPSARILGIFQGAASATKGLILPVKLAPQRGVSSLGGDGIQGSLGFLPFSTVALYEGVRRFRVRRNAAPEFVIPGRMRKRANAVLPVMAGLVVPVIQVLFVLTLRTWMPGTRPGMMAERLCA